MSLGDRDLRVPPVSVAMDDEWGCLWQKATAVPLAEPGGEGEAWLPGKGGERGVVGGVMVLLSDGGLDSVKLQGEDWLEESGVLMAGTLMRGTGLRCVRCELSCAFSCG